jgi:hypothetical protein
MKLFHGTSSVYLPEILKSGLELRKDPCTGEEVVCLTDDPYAAEWFAFIKCYGIDDIMPFLRSRDDWCMKSWRAIERVGGVPIIVYTRAEKVRLSEEYDVLNRIFKDKIFQIYLSDVAIPAKNLRVEIVKNSLLGVVSVIFRSDLIEI